MSESQNEYLDLPVEQGALLWGMRVWVMGLRRDVSATRRIREMMARLDVPHAAAYLEGFMFALQHGAIRTLGVCCACRSQVSEDEQTLLDALALAQERRPFEALLLLRSLLTPEGARAALCSAEALGTALAQVGRFLPAPDAEIRHFGLSLGAADGARPSDATLH